MACIRKYRGRWVVDWRDPSGKRFIESVAEDSREAAKRRLGEILKTGEQPASKKLTFRGYAEWWLENCARGNIKESTFEEYKRSLKVHLYPVFESKPIVKIGRKMVRELIASKKKEGLSQSTIRNMLAPMRGMYNQAIEDGDCHQNPASRMGKFNKKQPNEPDKKINPFTREEVQAMVVAAREISPHYYPLFLCAPRTGIREGELIALKGVDVDFKGRFIHVERNLSRGKITLPKNGKTRKVDMSAQLAGVLQDLLSRKRSEALRREIKRPVGERRDAAMVVNEVMEGWLFTTPQGTQLDPSNMRKVFYRFLASARLRRIRFHDLRHTFASLLLQNGESPAYVKEQMGHHSIKITVDTYGHLIPGGNRQAVDRLDDIVRGMAAVTEGVVAGQ